MLVCAAQMFPKRGKYDRRSSLKQHLLNDFLRQPSCNISHPLLCMVVPFVKFKGMQKPIRYFLQACRKPFRTWFKYKYRLKLDLSSGSFTSGPSKKDKRAHNIHHTQCKNYQAALVTFLPARSIAIFQQMREMLIAKVEAVIACKILSKEASLEPSPMTLEVEENLRKIMCNIWRANSHVFPRNPSQIEIFPL